jgi:LPS export ABC transporter protein LptC
MINFFMKRSMLFILSLVLFSIIFFLIKDETISVPEIKQKGESFIEGLRIVNKKNGQKNWVLIAKRADISDSGKKAYLTDLEMVIEGKGIRVHADRGLYDMTDKNLSIAGKIIARGEDYTVTSDTAEYDGETGNLETESPVLIEGRRFRLRGKGMRIDSAEGKVRIERDVKAVFYH